MMCNNHPLIYKHKKVFSQAIMAYREKKNDLAIIGLLVVIDGLLTDVSGNFGTNIITRAKAVIEKVEENEIICNNDIIPMTLAITFQRTMESLSESTSFTGKEPKNLNRHWILHGRSYRRKTKLDCIKILNFIYGILLINDYADIELNDI